MRDLRLIPYLHRYWFTFTSDARDRLSARSVLLGCGVTAFDYEDAIRLLKEVVFPGEALPTIAACIEDVDVSDLDAGHVRPNTNSPVWRGVWFPKDYQ